MSRRRTRINKTAALKRLTKAFHNGGLLGAHEVARCLGISKQVLTNWITRKKFVKPRQQLRATGVWDVSQIAQFVNDYDNSPRKT